MRISHNRCEIAQECAGTVGTEKRGSRGDLYAFIGRRVEQALADSGMKQVEMAKILGVHPSAVQRWITGENRIEVAQLRRVAEVLGRPIGWFVGDEPLTEEEMLAYELHRLGPDDQERALGVIRVLRSHTERQAARHNRTRFDMPAG